MAETSRVEKYVIDRVKEKRIEVGLSQIALSQKLNMSDSFVGHVETPKRRAKNNIKHLNALAKLSNVLQGISCQRERYNSYRLTLNQ